MQVTKYNNDRVDSVSVYRDDKGVEFYSVKRLQGTLVCGSTELRSSPIVLYYGSISQKILFALWQAPHRPHRHSK